MSKRKTVWTLALATVVLILGTVWTQSASARAAETGAASGSSLSSASMLTAVTTVYPVTITSALISGSDVVVTATVNAVPASDNGLYHLVASEVYESDVMGTAVSYAYIGDAGQTLTFTFPLNDDTADSNLYRKFTVVCIQNGASVAVSNPYYIENPEEIAAHTAARYDGGKKGLLPEATLIGTDTLSSAGIEQVTYNVLLGNLLNGSGITYTYNGKTYSFNATTVSELDYLIPIMNTDGIQVTLILLNNRSDTSTTNIHPLSRDNTSQNYYAFNTAEQAGVEQLAAAVSFLAERYSGGLFGTVDNWIVGNEINARSPWNYMNASAGFEYYTAEYVKAFRICYNAVKSQNANARVYTCVDQEYAQADDASLHYAGQTFLTFFNAMISATGNIYWDVAVHPYDYPLYDTLPWLQTAVYPDQVSHTQESPYVTMANIDVFTDFMCSAAMLDPDGEVRSIICSEQGYVSATGEELQAAAVVYGYTQALNNQYIDGFVLNREQDHADEVAQGLNFGIIDTAGNKKLAWTWYRDAETDEILSAASAIIGAPVQSLMTVR